jgi:transcriptional regulator with XRE-family HTH domain
MTNVGRHPRGPVDIEIGKRIRVRRVLLSMTQRTLAGALGVTWQQVHKFERGLNRVGTSRLAAMAEALGVPISYFFGDELAQTSQRMPSDLMERSETLKLMRLYYAIRDERVRRQVLAIVEAVAEASAPPSEGLEQDGERQAI